LDKKYVVTDQINKLDKDRQAIAPIIINSELH